MGKYTIKILEYVNLNSYEPEYYTRTWILYTHTYEPELHSQKRYTVIEKPVSKEAHFLLEDCYFSNLQLMHLEFHQLKCAFYGDWIFFKLLSKRFAVNKKSSSEKCTIHLRNCGFFNLTKTTTATTITITTTTTTTTMFLTIFYYF